MLYKDEILDHYRHPQNFGKLTDATHKGEMANASCGDEIYIEIILDNDRVKDVRFTGRGCAMSIASASVLTEFVKSKTVAEIGKLGFEDITNLIGEVNPGRQKCVMLPLRAVNLALA